MKPNLSLGEMKKVRRSPSDPSDYKSELNSQRLKKSHFKFFEIFDGTFWVFLEKKWTGNKSSEITWKKIRTKKIDKQLDLIFVSKLSIWLENQNNSSRSDFCLENVRENLRLTRKSDFSTPKSIFVTKSPYLIDLISIWVENFRLGKNVKNWKYQESIFWPFDF